MMINSSAASAVNMDGVVVSPLARDPSEVPRVSLVEYILPALRANAAELGDAPWVVDVIKETSVKFSDIEDHSRRVASALSKRGFTKGDVLYFVTYEMAHLYVVQLAVWRLGGAVRGSFQSETPAEYARQLRETGSRIVLVDVDTSALLHDAVAQLEWPVQFVSVGPEPVAGVTSYAELLQDDGEDCPEKVDVDPCVDAVLIPSTSGSTGVPKGAVHSHFSVVSLLHSIKLRSTRTSQIALASNYAVGNFTLVLSTLVIGSTMNHIGKFVKEEFFGHLIQCKPQGIFMYPYVASWFARSAEIQKHDLRFLRWIMVGGSVLDPSTLQLLDTKLPNVMTFQLYGISECIGISNSTIGFRFPGKSIKTVENQGETCLSSGKLGPYVQAKIRDLESGRILGRGERGEILVRSPHIMMGYIKGSNGQLDRSAIDQEGWFCTGDIGFFDDEGNIYIKERRSFVFKYYMHFVSPTEIESVLQEHEAVQAAGVVGIPNPETTSLARAFVVLRAGCSATSEQLEQHVAARLPDYMHLHGGVRFIDNLPMNRGGKLDRGALNYLVKQEDISGD